MTHNKAATAVGDWIHSYSPGIWQVFRIIEGVQKARFRLDERKQTRRQPIIFCRRLLDASWSPSFAGETCDPAVVHPLTDDERAKLDDFISKNPDVADQFFAYEPRNLDCALGLTLSLPEGIGKADLENLVRQAFGDLSDRGLTNDEILHRLAASPIAAWVSQRMINATLRLICKNHELRENEYVFREAQVNMI